LGFVLCALLLLLLLAAGRRAPAALADQPRQYNAVDDRRFHKRVAAAAAASSPAACARPAGAIILTVLTSGLFPLRQLQARATRLVPGEAACLGPHTVTACLDAACETLCERAELPGCVALGNVSALAPFAPMWTADYKYINLLKLEALSQALSVAQQVLFVDSDVLLFRSPWAAAGPPAEAPLRFQTEQARLPGGTACEEDEANGGVLLLSRAPSLPAFFEALFSHSAEMLAARAMNATDQAFLLPAARAAGTPYCGLPSDVFVGQCQLGRDGVANFSRIVSYHPTCACAGGGRGAEL